MRLRCARKRRQPSTKASRAGNRTPKSGTTQQTADYAQDKRFADHEDYTDEHARVFSALTDAQQAHNGEAVYLDEVARCSGLPREQTRALLHGLAAVHRLVTILPGADDPDLGPRF